MFYFPFVEEKVFFIVLDDGGSTADLMLSLLFCSDIMKWIQYYKQPQSSYIISIVWFLRKIQNLLLIHHPFQNAVLQLRQNVKLLLQLRSQLFRSQIRLLNLNWKFLVYAIF